ncbi:hypothetical protein KSD_73160 [Ktedonobacter sp. SOSP1-85]|uniref:serine/threonine-protein kinase n=1 Tax=Ktedonobacter sp. SOSP1-85 TaxID=2778367 RepID=UPI001915711A|nr:serine/threonine-protein kinase [Ktedonobacter sp. SOSP1-85]GHO79545.1 hypothetical protein KSD_73160 [Ktedonobacter sp. SOSP1-85]
MTERDSREGQQLGNYRLERLLGRGGFAEVYLGQHIRLQRAAAIKVLHASLSQREREDFQREAQIIAALDHPHIVRILDFDVHNGVPFLVMDYLPNGTLRQRHHKGECVPLPTVVSYIKQVADALQYAHDQRLIHRDIKPENMLVGRHNEIVLSDFGIAAIAHSTSSMTSQASAGTIPYMAPEQIQAQARAASDQYALAIVAYEWLCGERPFEGTYTEIFAKHLMTPPPPLHQKVPALPVEVEQVILTALEKDPKQRFHRVQAFAKALEEASRTAQKATPIPVAETISPHSSSPLAAGGLTVPAVKTVIDTNSTLEPSLPPTVAMLVSPTPQSQAVPASPLVDTPTETSTPARSLSRRAVIIGLATAGVATVGGGIWWLSAATHPDLPRNLLYIYSGHTDNVRAVVWSPDGKRIASGSADWTVQVWDAANGSHGLIYNEHDEVSAVAWSPDGKHIASSGGVFGKVYVWNAANGNIIATCDGHSLGVKAVAWSPDSKYFASGNEDNTVHVWNAANGANTYTYANSERAVSFNALAWSQDGKYIASGSSDSMVQVWNATNGNILFTYSGHAGEVNAVAWSRDGKYIASGSSDSTVKVWDTVTGGTVFTYRGHNGSINAVAWSPDGKHIASGSADKTVQVWDAANGNMIVTYRGHTDSVNVVAWSPDGKRIASGSADKTVQIWEVKS